MTHRGRPGPSRVVLYGVVLMTLSNTTSPSSTLNPPKSGSVVSPKSSDLVRQFVTVIVSVLIVTVVVGG